MSYKINYTQEEKIKLAKDDSVEKLYESRKNQRTVRVLTVCAYVLTVSLAAIILSAYYVFLWVPSDGKSAATSPLVKCEKVVIPEAVAIRLANNTEISAQSFYNNIINEFYKSQKGAQDSSSEGSSRKIRIEFNNYLESKFTQLVNDARLDMKFKKSQRSLKKNKKKYPDDEDSDTESSGDKSNPITIFPTTPDPLNDLNDTTIIFDQD